jgi:hypothetical protein
VCLCRYHKIPSGYISPCAYAFENHILACRCTHEVCQSHGHACFTPAYRPAGRLLPSSSQAISRKTLVSSMMCDPDLCVQRHRCISHGAARAGQIGHRQLPTHIICVG